MSHHPSFTPAVCATDGVAGRQRRVAVVGAGRLGTVLARLLAQSGHDVRGPLGRDYVAAAVAGVEVALLCVPDRHIADAAASWRDVAGDSALVGHCSGASGLDVLASPNAAGMERCFSLHPLMTFSAAQPQPALTGAVAAVAGASPVALDMALELAEALGLRPVVIADRDRAAYHAAASIASNFMVTVQGAAEQVAATCGVTREMLAPLVRQTVENWVADGAAALTGPVARGDEATVGRQRAALAERLPELLELFDSLVAATRTAATVPARGLAA